MPVDPVGARRAFGRAAAASSDGRLYLVVGFVYALVCTAYYTAYDNVARLMSEEERTRRKRLFEMAEWVAGTGFLLVFGWYFKGQLGFRGGGPGGGRSVDVLNSLLGNWGNDFFYITVAFTGATAIGYLVILAASGGRLRFQPALDWLAAYLLLMVLGSSLISHHDTFGDIR